MKLDVFDVLGQKVATILDQEMQIGDHSVHFDGRHFQRGLFVLRFEASGFQAVRKMLFVP